MNIQKKLILYLAHNNCVEFNSVIDIFTSTKYNAHTKAMLMSCKLKQNSIKKNTDDTYEQIN